MEISQSLEVENNKLINSTRVDNIVHKSGKMITQKQLKVLRGFKNNIFQEFLSVELKNRINERSSAFFNNAINVLENQNLILSRKIGNQRLLRLNLENSLIFNYLEILFLEELDEDLRVLNKKIVREFRKIDFFYSVIIFGSYAKNLESKNSDVDIAILVDSSVFKKEIEILTNNVKRTSLFKLDFQVFTLKEFKKMLKVDYENLGKEIARYNIPLTNSKSFYLTIKKEIENGFKL